MDDNKMLTLASNERIPLKPHMRLLFEIRDLRFATPATVSRAGIIYTGTCGNVWRSIVASWVQSRPDQVYSVQSKAVSTKVLTKLPSGELGPYLGIERSVSEVCATQLNIFASMCRSGRPCWGHGAHLGLFADAGRGGRLWNSQWQFQTGDFFCLLCCLGLWISAHFMRWWTRQPQKV